MRQLTRYVVLVLTFRSMSKLMPKKRIVLTATLLKSNHTVNNSLLIYFMPFYRENFDEELLPPSQNEVITR